MVCAILKIAYQGEIRRTRVTNNEIVYDDIREAVSALFPDVKEYAAMYIDDEGDACTLCQASFSDFLVMSKKTCSQSSAYAQQPEKLLLKLEIKDAKPSTPQALANETFEKQLKQAVKSIEQVAQGLNFAQCREGISEFVHGFLSDSGGEVQSGKPTSRSVSFTDTEGDRSTLRLDNQMLSWHAGGRCYLERIKRLEFDAKTNAIKTPEHPALVASLVDPPAGLQRDALIQDIVDMAGIAGVELHGFPMQSLPSRVSDSLAGKPGIKENTPVQERPTVRLPAEETFEKQLKQAMEHVVQGIDFAQCHEDVTELVHGFLDESGEKVECGEPSSRCKSFTDTEGDRSTLRLDHQMLSWHAGGRCYLERIKRLEFDTDTNAIKAPEHPALVARLVDPPAGLQRDALIQDIVHMAGIAGVELHGFPMQSLPSRISDLPSGKPGMNNNLPRQENSAKAESEMQQAQVLHTEDQNVEELQQKAEKDAPQAEKEQMKAEKEERLTEKEKQRAEKDALKAHKIEEAAKRAEKAMQKAEKAAKLAEKENQKAEKEAQKAEKERQKAERLMEKEAKVAEKKAQKQLQKETQKNKHNQQEAEQKAVSSNEGGTSHAETMDQITATRFGFPVTLADGCELQMAWSAGDDLQQVGEQFAQEHGLPAEIVPQLVSHAQQLDKSSSEPAAAEEDPLEPQIRLLQDMGIRDQLDDQVLRSLLVSCNGDVQTVLEMLIHQ